MFVNLISFHPALDFHQTRDLPKPVPWLNLYGKIYFYLQDLDSLPFNFGHPSALQGKNRPLSSILLLSDP